MRAIKKDTKRNVLFVKKKDIGGNTGNQRKVLNYK